MINTYIKEESYYLIDLTRAYKNDQVTKEEYKDLIAYVIFFVGLRISKLKTIPEITTNSMLFASASHQSAIMLSQPKPGFKIGGIMHEGEEIILTPKMQSITLPRINERITKN